VWGIVLAAGSGNRFGARKQFALLDGARLVDHAVAGVKRATSRIVLVLPAGLEWKGAEADAVVAGGDTRADSVRAGLERVPLEADIVVVHDAAHPLAQPQLFDAVVAALDRPADAAVPVVPVADTMVRLDNGDIGTTAAAAGWWAMQMPHAFRAEALRTAHAGRRRAVDDASLLHAIGRRVVTVPGDPTNLHVATTKDIELAASVLHMRRRLPPA
jgi:2-C-methyl-D-erythritol 4-phosphate cytidylyltransferase